VSEENTTVSETDVIAIKNKEKRSSGSTKKRVKKQKKGSTGLLNDEPLYIENNTLEDMSARNKNFYEKTFKKTFTLMMKEEKKHLSELIDSEYYPKETKEPITDVDLIKNHLNLIT
jgi:hypothetical protein